MRLPVLILCIIIFFSACNDKLSYTYQKNKNLPQLKAEWELEYTAWKELDIQDYQFIFHDGNIYPVRITVKEGTCHNVEAKGSSEAYSHYKTIDDLFLAIAGDFESDEREEHHPEQIRTSYTVRYHPQYHYPEYYSIIHVMATSGWGGNGWDFSVDKFSRLEDLEEDTWQPNENMPKLLDEWEKQYEAWKSLNIKNYQYIYQKCYDPAQLVYWDYRSKITIKNGEIFKTSGLSPAGFMGDYMTIDRIFHDIYGKFEEEIYYGWDNWPKIGMYFTVNYNPVYHYPEYFEYGDIYDPSWRQANPKFRDSTRISEFILLDF
jgi:hypothetical protein